jgi:hypothetical protein
MRLGYVIGARRGGVDALLAQAAAQLQAEGWNLAGVVQINPEVPGRRCDMELILLGADQRFRISQCLGPQARGCRLDPEGLEAAVGRVEGRLDRGLPQLLIVNKFGKAEIGGRGFRPVIARALGEGVPVLVGVNKANLDGFQDFAQGIGTPLPEDPGAVLDWCRGAVRDAA